MTGLTLSIQENLLGVEKSAKMASVIDDNFKDLLDLFVTEVARLTPVVTGNLASSITAVHTGFLNGEVSTINEYAGYVEFGTSRFPPRAMFRKGAVLFKDKGLAMLAEKLKNANI